MLTAPPGRSSAFATAAAAPLPALQHLPQPAVALSPTAHPSSMPPPLLPAALLASPDHVADLPSSLPRPPSAFSAVVAAWPPDLRSAWHDASRRAYKLTGPLKAAGSLAAYLETVRRPPFAPAPHLRQPATPATDALAAARREGVDIPGFTMPRRHTVRNLGSLRGREFILAGRLLTEVQAGRMLALPRAVLPFLSDVTLSPMGCVVKNHAPETSLDPKDWRLVHHLSWPSPHHDSVNAATDLSSSAVPSYTLPNLDRVCSAAWGISQAAGPPPVAYKGDVTDAFRHIPLANRIVPFFCIALGPLVFADFACMFGWSASPPFFSLVPAAVESLHRPRHPNYDMYVDDGFGVEAGRRAAQRAAAHWNSCVRQCLGPHAVAVKKAMLGQRIPILGLELDLVDLHLRVPALKLSRARATLHHALSLTHPTDDDIGRVVGVLRHLCLCAPPLRAALNLFIDAQRVARLSLTPAPAPAGWRELCEWWLLVTAARTPEPDATTASTPSPSDPVGSATMSWPLQAFAPPTTAHTISTDASSRGCFAAVHHTMLEHFAAVWASPDLPHINTTEFATLVGAVEQWQHTLSPASVTNFHVDNRTAIAWARRLRAPAGLPQSLALPPVVFCTKNVRNAIANQNNRAVLLFFSI